MNFDDFIEDYQKAKSLFSEFYVVTLVSYVGSVPQVVGARLIVSKEGYFSGTIGGGKLEKAAIDKSISRLNDDKMKFSFFEEWNLQTDIHMSCGGVVKLFFEMSGKEKTWNIVIFGAGHISQELCRVLVRLDCEIVCVDTRTEWLEKIPQNRKIKSILAESFSDYVAQVPSNAFVVIATMGHGSDLPVLIKLHDLGIRARYIGVIGSELKAKKLRLNLSDAKVGKEFCDSLFCPMGEDLGQNTPPEIAISIVAQLLKMRDEKS